MAGSPVRRIRIIDRATATIVNGTAGRLVFERPMGVSPIAPGTSAFKNLTTQDTNDKGDLAGKATVSLDALTAVAASLVRKLATVDKDGNDVDVMFDDAVGIAGNNALVATLLANVPVNSDENLAVTIFNSAGAPLAAGATALFDLGVNSDQETVLS